MQAQTIIEPTMQYDFSPLSLGPPSSVVGGAHFTKLLSRGNQSLFVQTPKCLTKQGLVKSGKKMYLDLMFDNNDTVFIHWMEQLENICQELLSAKGQQWFETPLDKMDIEHAFTSPFRLYKSGKYYLMRVYVKPTIRVYNEQHQVVPVEDMTIDKHLVSIIEIQGIRFSSRNFQLEIELKQAMMVSPDPFLDMCFIKRGSEPTHAEPHIESQVVTLAPLIEDIGQPLAQAKLPMAQIEEEEDDEEPSCVKAPPICDLQPKPYNVSLQEEECPQLIEVPFPEPEEDMTTEEDPELLTEIMVDDVLDNVCTEVLTLKQPDEVYQSLYQTAKHKAKEAAQMAMHAYAEMKRIKQMYGLEDIETDGSSF